VRVPVGAKHSNAGTKGEKTMRSKSMLLIAASLLFFLPATTYAWNKAGHMVTAAIAYRELKAIDPQALTRVIALLKKHPHFATTWRPRIEQVQPDDPDMFLFMLASRWPDDIRNTSLHCEKCHFTNFPFKSANQPASVVTQPPDQQNIVSAFRQKVSVLRSATASQPQKAMALAWIFHLIGDVHQPLHTSSLFTTLFPTGDRGGTRFFIRVEEDRATIKLHKFWDDLIIGSERFRSVRNRATELHTRADLQRGALQELSETRFEKWAKPESFDAAVRHAYRNGTLEGSPDDQDGSVLPDDYAAAVKPIAERRAALAGYRLADFLKKNF
jgi:hypothetical protein